mgnify:CR=1 FL=1
MIINKIIYVISVVLLLVVFVLTANAAALAAAVALLAMPVITVVACRASVAALKLDFELPHSCVVGSPLVLHMTLDRPALFRGRVELVFTVRNLLTGAHTTYPVSLAPASARPAEFNLELDSSICGARVITLDSARLVDEMGFTSLSLENIAYRETFAVYPRVVDIQVDPRQSASAGLEGTSYDPHRSGQDPSEVFDLRPYRKGDAVKSIHWKLSTRFDDVLVREASRPQDHAIAILFGVFASDFERSDRSDALSATLSFTASVSLALMRQGHHHLVVTASEGALGVYPVDDRRGFDKMLDALMATPLASVPPTSNKRYAKLVKARGISKTVLMAAGVNESDFVNMGRLADLSVLHVSDSVESYGVEHGPNYVITHCPASVDSGRIKSLEI